MRNLLQDKLLKAGLVKKNKVDQVVREQAKQRQGKAPTAPVDAQTQVDAQLLQAQRAERDRALAAERKEQTRLGELRAQIRQIVESNKVPRQGESVYRFTDGSAIKSVLINESLRARLAVGTLVIARVEPDHFELLPRDAADRISKLDPSVIVLHHARTTADNNASVDAEDPYYSKFVVPDDLIW